MIERGLRRKGIWKYFTVSEGVALVGVEEKTVRQEVEYALFGSTR